MTSTHRLIALTIIWIVLGTALFYAFSISIFVPTSTVIALASLLLVSGIAATWLVMRGLEKRLLS